MNPWLVLLKKFFRKNSEFLISDLLQKVKMLLLLLYVVSGMTASNKQDQCYLLSTNLIREHQDEIKVHMKQHPHLKEPEVRLKAIEQGYFSCMSLISDSQLKSLLNSQRKEYSKYSSLIKLDFSSLRSLKDVALSPEYLEIRKQISKRVSFASKPTRDEF